MTTASKTVPTVCSTKPKTRSIAEYLGPAPLIDGEDREAYNRILQQITTTVAPNDPLEEIWIRDIVDLTWEALRWRRYSAHLITSLMQEAVLHTLHPLIDPRDAMVLSIGYGKRQPQALVKLDEVLGKLGLSMDAIATRAASARSANLERLEVFERLASAAEGRRNIALREIARHREGFAHSLRKAAEEIEEGEFQEIAPPEPSALPEAGHVAPEDDDNPDAEAQAAE